MSFSPALGGAGWIGFFILIAHWQGIVQILMIGAAIALVIWAMSERKGKGASLPSMPSGSSSTAREVLHSMWLVLPWGARRMKDMWAHPLRHARESWGKATDSQRKTESADQPVAPTSYTPLPVADHPTEAPFDFEAPIQQIQAKQPPAPQRPIAQSPPQSPAPKRPQVRYHVDGRAYIEHV